MQTTISRPFIDAQMKRALLERSGSVAIAVLNEKLSTSASFQVAPVEVVADLVVEADAPKKFVSGFESRGTDFGMKRMRIRSGGSFHLTTAIRLKAAIELSAPKGNLHGKHI